LCTATKLGYFKVSTLLALNLKKIIIFFVGVFKCFQFQFFKWLKWLAQKAAGAKTAGAKTAGAKTAGDESGRRRKCGAEKSWTRK